VVIVDVQSFFENFEETVTKCMDTSQAKTFPESEERMKE
jgi:hypothetical protein